MAINFVRTGLLPTALLLLASALLPLHASAESLALPDIGDSSATTISPAEEKQLGREVIRSIRQSGALLNDLEAESYIRKLGYRLASVTGQSATDFSFYIVSDPAINAFATPGGYVCVNSGLILASRSESELAGVMAHEIAHVTQHHLARSFEKANQMNLPLTAAVIGAILLGASNPQLGEAALAASMGGSSQMQLNFTRANEQEADRVGIQTLARAGFDPNGMPDFFERLQQEYRFANSNMPEFLSTHPVTLARIADSRNRAAQLPPVPAADDLEYRLIQAKIRVIESTDVAALTTRLHDELATGRYADETAERYGYALALTHQGKYDEARKELTRMAKAAPGRIAYMLALANLETAAANYDAAASYLHDGLKLYPGNPLLTLGSAELSLQRGQNREALVLLRDFTRNRDVPPHAYELLAEAETRNGNAGIAHIALADYYHSLDQLPAAIEQLHLARQDHGLDFYHQSLLEAKLSQFEQESRAADAGKPVQK